MCRLQLLLQPLCLDLVVRTTLCEEAVLLVRIVQINVSNTLKSCTEAQDEFDYSRAVIPATLMKGRWAGVL